MAGSSILGTISDKIAEGRAYLTRPGRSMQRQGDEDLTVRSVSPAQDSRTAKPAPTKAPESPVMSAIKQAAKGYQQVRKLGTPRSASKR